YGEERIGDERSFKNLAYAISQLLITTSRGMFFFFVVNCRGRLIKSILKKFCLFLSKLITVKYIAKYEFEKSMKILSREIVKNAPFS
ncbi:unnamed protein product, partial [Arabidopsis halleri]